MKLLVGFNLKASPMISAEQLMKQLSEQFNGNSRLYKRVLALLLEQTPAYLGDLQAAIAKGEPEEVRRSAHTLKGALGNVIQTGPYQIAFEIETLGREGSLQGIEALYESLTQEVNDLKDTMQQVLMECSAV